MSGIVGALFTVDMSDADWEFFVPHRALRPRIKEEVLRALTHAPLTAHPPLLLPDSPHSPPLLLPDSPHAPLTTPSPVLPLVPSFPPNGIF